MKQWRYTRGVFHQQLLLSKSVTSDDVQRFRSWYACWKIPSLADFYDNLQWKVSCLGEIMNKIWGTDFIKWLKWTLHQLVLWAFWIMSLRALHSFKWNLTIKHSHYSCGLREYITLKRLCILFSAKLRSTIPVLFLNSTVNNREAMVSLYFLPAAHISITNKSRSTACLKIVLPSRLLGIQYKCDISLIIIHY